MSITNASFPRGTRTQRGGTLLGFLLGLLVGIGAALAVAVYVTKVPIPLVDRGVQRRPTQPQTEAERLRDWNPNAGLSAAKPAPATPANTPSADTPASPDAAASAGGSSAEADPIAALIQQRTGQAKGGDADTPANADPFQYYVQVGAFRSAEEAEAQRARLALQGFDAKVSEREQAGQRVFRVRLGPFANRVEAEIMQQRLEGKQFETALVRVQR
jgi:cell division protein FtsN